VARIDELIAGLDQKARALLSSDANIDLLAMADGGAVDVPVSEEKRAELAAIAAAMKELKDLKWRYEEGPSGRGRASLGITNSTGCSSVWGSTYPFNPYPFPWVNHLFQDAPSVAIGIFEGHMRKMGDAFIAVRRAAKLLDGSYDKAKDEAFFTGSAGRSSPTRSSTWSRRSWPWAVMAPCWTSASRTCLASWRAGSRSGW
jgi:pyruvate-ferredoxin/flavodoxin oxidoreductase